MLSECIMHDLLLAWRSSWYSQKGKLTKSEQTKGHHRLQRSGTAGL